MVCRCWNRQSARNAIEIAAAPEPDIADDETAGAQMRKLCMRCANFAREDFGRELLCGHRPTLVADI